MAEQRSREEGDEKNQKVGDGEVTIVTNVEELDSSGDNIFMMEQRGEIRIEKDQQIGDGWVTSTETNEDVEELDSSTSDEIYSMELEGEVRYEKDQKDGDGGVTINRLPADSDVKKQESNGQDCEDYLYGFIEFIMCLISCICCFYCCLARHWVTLASRPDDNVADLEFGRDTSRHDYFAVTPWNVYRQEDISRIDSNGGVGDGGGGGGRTRQVSLRVSSNNGRKVSSTNGGIVDASHKSTGGEGGASWRQRWKKCWLS